MHRVISPDGASIAYDRLGTGAPVILIGGAFSYRVFPKTAELAELLSEHFTVINYDRRGRGDSGDTPEYAVEREIEDLQALIEAAGGSASLWGWSSGGVLAVRAAAHGLNVEKIAVYEPPFIVDRKFRVPPDDFETRLRGLVRADRRSTAVRYFMTNGMGVPSIVVGAMRLTPMWSKLRAVAHTLPYDWAVRGDTMAGTPLLREEWASVTVPTLVLSGEKSPEQLRSAARALADVLVEAEHRVLEGQSHNPSMKVQAPVLVDFFRTPAPASAVDRAPASRRSYEKLT